MNRTTGESQPTRTIEERERERAVAVAENMRVVRPILDELKSLGFVVSSLSALRDSGRYEGAIPLLVSWLPRLENEDILMEVARSVSVPYAKALAQQPLLDAYRAATQEHVKWAIGNGLEILADRKILDDLVAIARDRKHGKARQMVVLGLGKIKDPLATTTLVALLDDEDVAGHAVQALSKSKVPTARPHLERFVSHQHAWIRNAAKRGIAAIDKALAKAKGSG